MRSGLEIDEYYDDVLPFYCQLHRGKKKGRSGEKKGGTG